MRFVESQKIKNSFAFNVDIFNTPISGKKRLTHSDVWTIISKYDLVCKCPNQSPGRTFYHKIFREENKREDGNKPLFARSN